MLIAEMQWVDIAQYASLFGLSAFKFLFGLVTAIFAGFSFWEILAVVGGGAWISVWGYTYFGVLINKGIHRIYKRKKPMRFSRRRKIIKVWNRYGLAGISFLCIVISPMIAVGIAISFQERPLRIILYMTIAIVFWTLLFALASSYIQQWEFFRMFVEPLD